MAKSVVQNYPRTKRGLLDADTVTPHRGKITPEDLREIVLHAIHHANKKSSRAILDIPEGLSEAEVTARYKKSGKELFKYFVQYCGDPAATSHQCNGRHYAEVAREQFRNRTLQKERMNSGWRYQYIAKGIASHQARSVSLPETGTLEPDYSWMSTAGFSCEEIMIATLAALIETQPSKISDMPIPPEIVEAFGQCCRKASLLNEYGCFNDPVKLAFLLSAA